MLAAFADDLTIVAPPKVAVRIYSRYAYLNKVHNSSVFKGAKNVAFSMGRSAKYVKRVLKQEFQELRQLPQEDQGVTYTSREEADDRMTRNIDYTTDQCTDSQGNRSGFSLLVDPDNQLHFETHQAGFEAVELLGIPIKKEDSNGLTHMLIMKKLAKTMKTWEKTKRVIKKKHQHAQILTFCLRTRFHHFCRAVRSSKLKASARTVFQELQGRNDTENIYRNLPETADEHQSIVNYIDSWFLEQFLGVTGMWEADDVNAPNQLRVTFPRRRGGMGLTTLKDVIPGAFAATMLECFFPRGLTKDATPQTGDISLGFSNPVCNRQMPYWSVPARYGSIPPEATPTERLYLLSTPIRLSEDGRTTIDPDPQVSEELLTTDFQEVQQSLRELVSYPLLRCLLYGNEVLRQFGLQENALWNTSIVFGKTSLMYELVPQGDPEEISIDEELLKNTLDKQASGDQKTMQILSQTKTAISRRNRPREGEHHTPDAITTGAALVL